MIEKAIENTLLLCPAFIDAHRMKTKVVNSIPNKDGSQKIEP
jgi:hypothetical protein